MSHKLSLKIFRKVELTGQCNLSCADCCKMERGIIISSKLSVGVQLKVIPGYLYNINAKCNLGRIMDWGGSVHIIDDGCCQIQQIINNQGSNIVLLQVVLLS